MSIMTNSENAIHAEREGFNDGMRRAQEIAQEKLDTWKPEGLAATAVRNVVFAIRDELKRREG